MGKVQQKEVLATVIDRNKALSAWLHKRKSGELRKTKLQWSDGVGLSMRKVEEYFDRRIACGDIEVFDNSGIEHWRWRGGRQQESLQDYAKTKKGINKKLNESAKEGLRKDQVEYIQKFADEKGIEFYEAKQHLYKIGDS